MEQAIRTRFNDAILHEAMRRYAIAPEQIRPLPAFESFMYAFEQAQRPYILRIGHSLRRSPALIHGEVDWINYLARGGAGVAAAVASPRERLVEQIPDGQGGVFLATAFERAPGGPPGDGQWNEALFERYGRLIGRMHHLSTTYEPSDPAWKRPEWNDPMMLYAEKWLPPEQTAVRRRYRDLLAHLESLPKSRETYGLVHQDAHAGNFFVDEAGRITLFDFDDCVYTWYANDVAIVLFYAVTNRDDADAFAAHFLTHFLRGYRQMFAIEPAWLAQLPHFLKLREIDLYGVIYRSFDDVDNIENPWVARFMAGRRERIEQDVPYVTLPFADF